MCLVDVRYWQKLIHKIDLKKIKHVYKYSENNLARMNFSFTSSGKYLVLN